MAPSVMHSSTEMLEQDQVIIHSGLKGPALTKCNICQMLQQDTNIITLYICVISDFNIFLKYLS